jgi:DNA helicase-2/ATP-dependent DNA helicase PcrA
MTTSQLLTILYPPGQPKQLTPEQAAIIHHPHGPAWVLSGPGSGKTEILSIFVLRLLYVDNDPIQATRVPPDAVFITTFTEKAARNLEDRVAQKRLLVVNAHPELADIDTSKLRIGTLHALCNDLLQEFRAQNYQNVRLMDDFEQKLFIREHISVSKSPSQTNDFPFWSYFSWLFGPQEWKPAYGNLPSKWNVTRALVKLFGRLTEDRVSIPALTASGNPQLVRLGALYQEYRALLLTNFRCDFSVLQDRFLEFLSTPLGASFVNGDGSVGKPGIRWVLVDEYQDTNLMQEAIYFALAAPHRNVMVVGDDDQAMYRFRGGSVECMVTFNQACEVYLNIPRNDVRLYPLVTNFRSHPRIVQFFDAYMRSFPTMQAPGARAPKPRIQAGSSISGNYPAVATISGNKVNEVADSFAELVHQLIVRGIVQNPNQCCLLLMSAKESPRNAGPYVSALQSRGLQVYNPRNKAFLEQEEVQVLLGSLLAIVDPNRRYLDTIRNSSPGRNPPAVVSFADSLNTSFAQAVAPNSPLRNYVQQCVIRIRAAAQRAATADAAQRPWFQCNLQELAFYIICKEPFTTWQADPARRVRLARLTALLESYSSMPVMDPATNLPRPNVNRGNMAASAVNIGEVHESWLNSFYHLFLTYLNDTGLDDEEDDEVICPSGYVPVMTMHQSKGLEFPFVFVGHMGADAEISDCHRIEDLFSGYPGNPNRVFQRPSAQQRAEMDLIRQFYVAYSRAEHALVLLGTRAQFSKGHIPCGPTKTWLRNQSLPI